MQVSFFENAEIFLGTNVFNPRISITTSLRSESNFDLNKDYSNLRSNLIPSIVLIGSDDKEVDLWKTCISDWLLFFFVFKILSGSSTGVFGSGSRFLLIYLLLDEAKIS